MLRNRYFFTDESVGRISPTWYKPHSAMSRIYVLRGSQRVKIRH